MSTGNYVVGGYSNGVVGHSRVGDDNLNIRMYSATGAVLWTAQFGGTGEDRTPRTPFSSLIAVDSSDNIYAAARCQGSVNGVQSAGGMDACYFKFDSSGNQLCANQIGGQGNDVFSGIAVDSTNGGFYAVGSTSSANFDGKVKSGLLDAMW